MPVHRFVSPAKPLSRPAGAAPRLVFLVMAACFGLHGCIPRQVIVHDGLVTVVSSAATGAPIEGAFVVATGVFDAQGHTPLARSDAAGRLRLEPESRIDFVLPLSEGTPPMALAVCKEGYRPKVVAVGRGTWNADLGSPSVHRIERVKLEPAPGKTRTCADPFQDLFAPSAADGGA